MHGDSGCLRAIFGEKRMRQAVLRRQGNWLAHVHFAHPNIPSAIGRIFPTSMGEWPYAEFIGELRDSGYRGRVSVEAASPDFDAQAPKTLAFLRENF
jgi:sugar phosphate isomerase/epimerase